LTSGGMRVIIFDQFEDFLNFDTTVRSKTIFQILQLQNQILLIGNPDDRHHELSEFIAAIKVLFITQSGKPDLLDELAEQIPGIISKTFG
jgi:hypothetical protein